MKKIRLFGLLVFVGVLIAACNNAATPTKPRFQPYPEEAKILGLANAFRAQAQTCGNQQFAPAPALTWVEAIGDTAWFHSTDMGAADTENHIAPTTLERLKNNGFDTDFAAEHRKKTSLPANPDDAFNAWKADPAACANLMSPKFTVMGAGLWGQYEGGTSAYWTQILSAPKGTNAAPSLTVSPTTTTVTVGGAALAFSATLTNANDTINWTLTGPGSLSSSTGATTNYTPPATGGADTATLTASAAGLTATATITINAAAPALTVTPTTATTTVGGANVVITASSNQVSWSMTGPGTFSFVGSSFTYVPPATGNGGTAVVTATLGTLTASATITVGPTVSLTVSPTTGTVNVGGPAVPFTATLTNSTATIGWSLTGPGSLSSTTGATVNYTPPTTGAAGTATLTATAGLLTATATITINAAPAGGLQVQVNDLQRQVLVPPVVNGPLGLHLSDRPVAPMAANPNGGAFILWTRQGDNKAFLTQVDATGNPVGTDQDLGAGSAGAVGTDGTKVAYLLKTGDNQLAFKVVGGGQTLVVNNSQPGPWPNAATTFGNDKMLTPLDIRRVAVLSVGGNWFASFDHANDFGAGGIHFGMSMVMLDGNGTNPTLGVPWGTSHSLDILALFDGTNILNVTVGDAFPQDFRLHVLTPQGQVVGDKVDLFAKNNFDIGGDNVNSVPAPGNGVSSGKLGGLSALGGGQFALTYLIQNQPIPAKLNEIGMLTFDKQGTAKRFKLKDGTGVKYVRSARYGTNILVAWETTAGKFMAMVVDAQGNVVKAEQELGAGVVFSERDSFVPMFNGDIVWAASVGGNLKLFRLPSP